MVNLIRQKWIGLILILCLFCSQLTAQCPFIEIIDLRNVPGFAQFDDVNVCGEADTLSMIIYNGDPGSVLGFEMELELPDGLIYSGWEFTSFENTDVSNVDPDPSNPSFIVSGFDGDSLIVANIGIEATCDLDLEELLELGFKYEFTFIDSTNTLYKCENENAFDNELNSAIKVPVLNLLQGFTPNEVTLTSLNTEFCQTMSISQDGISSRLDAFNFEIIGLDLGTDLLLNSIITNGTNAIAHTYDASTQTASAVIDGQDFFNNSLANPADEFFNTNEVIEIEVCYQINACPSNADIPFTYDAWYGCEDDECQRSAQASFLRVRPTGAQMPTAQMQLISNPSVCGDAGEIALTIDNPNSDTDQNKYVSVNIGFETCESLNLGVQKVELAGNLLPAEVISWIGDDLNVDFSKLPAGLDPDGPSGLNDIDGDGVYDDLAGGESVSLSVFLEVLCGVSDVPPNTDICPSNNCSFAQFYVSGETNCGNAFKEFPTGISGFDIIHGPTGVSNPNQRDIPDGAVPPIAQGYDFGVFGDVGSTSSPNIVVSTEEVIFCYDFESTNFNACNDHEIILQINFSGQRGYIQDIDILSAELSEDGGNSYTSTANIATDTIWRDVADDSRILEVALGSDAANVCYRYTLEMDSIWCPVPSYWFGAQQVIERCNDPVCGTDGCDLLRACRTAIFYGDADMPSCPCILEGDVKELYRKNYGFTDASMTNQLTRSQVDSEDHNRFLPCDTLVMDYYWVITDQGAVDLPNLSRMDLAFWPRGSGTSKSTIEEAVLTFNPESTEILEFAVQKVGTPYANRSIVDFGAIQDCADSGLNYYFAKTPWGSAGVHTCSNSSDDIFDGTFVRLILYNRDKTQDICNSSNTGNCLDAFFDETNYEAGDTIRMTFQTELIKNPRRALLEAVGAPLPPASTNHRITNSSFIDYFDEGSNTCFVRLGSDCAVDPIYFGTCPGTVSSISKVDLNNCGGEIEHTFYMNPEIPFGWFDEEFRPILSIMEMDDPFFAPMAYCGNASVQNYVNGIPDPISIQPINTDNMFCVPVEGYDDDLCAITSGTQGTLFWNPQAAGARPLGIGNIAQDSLSLSYDFCLLCPELINATNYEMIYDYGYECQTLPEGCHFRCNGTPDNFCDNLGLPTSEFYLQNLVGDSLMIAYDNIGPNVLINDNRTPIQNVTADLGVGFGVLIASNNPGVSEEIQQIKICNPDPINTAEGVSATVTVPSSINFVNAYSDLNGTTILNSNLISDGPIYDIYQIDLDITSMLAGSPCQEIYIGTTLKFCPLPGSAPPEVCVAGISGCSPIEVRAALAESDGCGEDEVCYAYIFGEVGLQTEWFDMPEDPELCEDMIFNIRVKNVKELTLLDLVTSFQLPNGLTVDMSSWEVAFPGGPTTQGLWMPVPAPDLINGNVYSYSDDVIWSVPANTPIHISGLEGVSLANTTEDENQVAFRFRATTVCDEFLSGAKLITETTANDPCSEGTVSSGQKESPSVVIDGADPANSAQLLLIAEPQELNCQATDNIFGITALNTSDFPTADSVITCITIPSELSYTSGSLEVTQPVGYIPQNVTETIIGNVLQICFDSPKIGVSQAMKLQLEAAVDEAASCGFIRMDVDVKSVVESLNCATGPPCDVFVQNSLNPAVTIETKPPFAAKDWNVYSECGTADEISLFYEFTINHNGPDAVNQAYTANFYQDLDGNGLINPNADNLVSTTSGAFSVNDGNSITISGNVIVAAEDACPLMMEIVYPSACVCDREESRFDNIDLKFLAPYPEPISMCPGDCLEIEVCDFVEVTTDSVQGATGIEYSFDLDWSARSTYSFPHDSTQTPIQKGPPIDFLNYAVLTDNEVSDASGVGGFLFAEQGSIQDEAYLMATYSQPVNVERLYLGAGKVSGWSNILSVYGSVRTQLEYSLDGGNTWIDTGLSETHPSNNTDIFEYILPTPVAAQYWRFSSDGLTNWGTSEFRLEGGGLPFMSQQPVERNGNMVTICVPDGVGVDIPWEVNFTTGIGSCENIETIVINNIGDVEITLGPEIIACGTDCVDLEVEIIGDIGTLENATVSWSPQIGLSDPNSLETEVCVNADATYFATVTFPGGCVKTTSVDIDHQGNQPIEVDGADVECFNTKDHPILIAPEGFDQYLWFQIVDGVEIPLGSTTINELEITEAGGEYFVKGVSSGLDCPGRSPSYQITDRLLPQICLPTNININR